MQIHNGIRYKTKDAERLGLAKAEHDAPNKARTGPDGDKTRRPSRARSKGKGAPDGDAGSPAAG